MEKNDIQGSHGDYYFFFNFWDLCAVLIRWSMPTFRRNILSPSSKAEIKKKNMEKNLSLVASRTLAALWCTGVYYPVHKACH
jgi:hypothetical protein